MFDSLIIGAVGFYSWYTYCLLAAFLYTIAYIFEVELGNETKPPPSHGITRYYVLSVMNMLESPALTLTY